MDDERIALLLGLLVTALGVAMNKGDIWEAVANYLNALAEAKKIDIEQKKMMMDYMKSIQAGQTNEVKALRDEIAELRRYLQEKKQANPAQ